MIKGVNRQMIVMKLEGSAVYDSACFILRRGASRKEGERDMLREANRIISQMDVRGSRRRRFSWLWRFLFFSFVLLIGAVIGFALSLLL